MKSRLVGNTHLIAGRPDTISKILELLEEEGWETRGNPDLYVRACANFGIDEARELRSRASLKPIGERRIFVIATPGMTAEAQNALLKTLEEPPADALFFFIIPAPETLIPTLRSRAQTLTLERTNLVQVDAKQFLAANKEQRLDLLKPLLAKGDDEKRDIDSIIAFLAALEKEIAHAREDKARIRAVYRTRKYVTDKGALIKPLLEQVALLV